MISCQCTILSKISEMKCFPIKIPILMAHGHCAYIFDGFYLPKGIVIEKRMQSDGQNPLFGL